MHLLLKVFQRKFRLSSLKAFSYFPHYRFIQLFQYTGNRLGETLQDKDVSQNLCNRRNYHRTLLDARNILDYIIIRMQKSFYGLVACSVEVIKLHLLHKIPMKIVYFDMICSVLSTIRSRR